MRDISAITDRTFYWEADHKQPIARITLDEDAYVDKRIDMSKYRNEEFKLRFGHQFVSMEDELSEIRGECDDSVVLIFCDVYVDHVLNEDLEIEWIRRNEPKSVCVTKRKLAMIQCFCPQLYEKIKESVSELISEIHRNVYIPSL